MNEQGPSPAFVNFSQIAKWPAFLPQLPDSSVLDHVWVQALETDASTDLVRASTKVFIDKEIVLSIPGLDAIALTVAAESGGTVIPLEVEVYPELFIRLIGVPLSLRLSTELFKPVRQVGTPQPGQPPQFEVDPDKTYVDIELARVTLEINADGGINLQVSGGIDLPACMLGDSNIVIEAKDISIHLDPDSSPAGKPAGWRGIHIGSASLYLPGELAGIVGNLSLTDAYIGNGGFSGTVNDSWAPPLSASLFGMTFSLKQVSLTFVQSALTTASIIGDATLPFFDAPLEIEICPNMNGPFLVRLTGGGGLVTLTKPGVLSLDVESLGFAIDGSLFTVMLSGKVTPLIEGLDWPSFVVRELSIDSQGHVRLDGGWLDLPSQYALDFHGFKFEITKLGFGNSEDGGRWIGFSGGLKLVDGLSAGASVEGLRITWYNDGRPVGVTLNGVGVELEIPATLRLQGAVSYRELTVGAETAHRFDGRIKLELIALGFSVDATLVVGTASGPAGSYAFMAIYLDVELPAGIPLGTTGLGLFGMAGLFALNMEPDKHPDEEWYGIGPGEGWYHRGTVGVTDLAAKWVNRNGSIALGAGVTLGTVVDNGFNFSGKVLLVLVFPGPILLLEGKADILKERSKLDEEPTFRALAVLDGRAGSLLFGLDAQYKFGSGGELIDIHGSVEAFFSFVDASAWHLYIGMRDPKEKRVSAEIFKLFTANSYFMLDAHQVAMGAWVGYDKTWKFGPLKVVLEAWIEGNAVVSWKPVHLHGDLWLHGKAELKVYGFGLGLTVDARFEAEVFDPFHVLASFDVGISLPWPLPDFDVTIKLEWGPDPVNPPLPMPLKEIAVEHFKVTESWPLPRGGATPLLLPNYDADADGFRSDPVPDPAVQAALPAPDAAPVVPLDARPHVTFGRSVHDAALVGVNALPVVPAYERIGDPAANQGPVNVKYSLTEVALDRWNGAGWTPVARKGTTSNPAGVATLYGSWAPMPAMPDGNGENVGQSKLWLWSKSAFDYTRHSGRSWEDWFTNRFDGYPCPPPLRDDTICCDFEREDPNTPVLAPWRWPELPDVQLGWLEPQVNHVSLLPQPIQGKTHALCFDGPAENPDFGALVLIDLANPAKRVRVLVTDARESVSAFGYDENGQQSGPVQVVNNVITIAMPGLVKVLLRGRAKFCLLQVCVTYGPSKADLQAREDMIQHQQDELARWSQQGEVLQPYSTYRLKIATHIETVQNPIGDYDHVEFAYFRTEGPPGLVNPSAPIGAATDFQSALRDLSRYVRQTVPATVPGTDQKPPLPRPVYRGYDVGVEFNESYVELMYRISGRDLGLYLFDNNNRPVRDARGRLIVMTNRWGVAETLSLTQSDTHWITTINASTCVTLDTTGIPHDSALGTANEEQILSADTLYEARLIPLLLHEAFDKPALGASADGPAGSLAGWSVVDEGSNQGPSHWEIRETGVPPSRYIVQTGNIWGGSTGAGDPVKPGALLLRADNPLLPANHSEQPGNWTDYRFSVYLRSQDDDTIGLVFRFVDRNWHYRFAFDRERRYRRLLRVAGGVTTILAEDDFTYQKDQDYRITVEAIGSSIRLYQDGEPVFSVDDASMSHGRIGLYCWANEGACFADVMVDDFRVDAPVPYRFKFTTSGFVNFLHQLHSFQDETWKIDVPAAAGLAEIARAGAPVATITEAEARAYEALVAKFGAAPTPAGSELRVSRVEQNGAAFALWVESPEPVDWVRTDLSLLRARRYADAPTVPGIVKMIETSFSQTAEPNEESVTLLLRDAASLADWAIEHRRIPGPLSMPREGAQLFRDDFMGGDRGLLFSESFGLNALDHYDIVDEGTLLGPSAWQVNAGLIRQTSNVYGGSVAANDPAKPGTYAVTGQEDWRDVRIRAAVSAQDDDGIGIAFRWKDSDNYYRFSMDAERQFRRLIKKVAGVVTVLWEDGAGYSPGQTYDIDIVAVGDRLVGFLDNRLLFNLHDDALQQGRVGLYCWANQNAMFHALTVEKAVAPFVLWEPAFANLDGLDITVENGAQGLPAQWSAAAGLLRQSAGIFVPDPSPLKPGTYAVGGSADWSDIEICVDLQSSQPGAVGVMFRYVDRDNYYRFSMDASANYRRLIRNVGGVVSVLWQASAGFSLGRPQGLTLRLQGPHLSGFLNGTPLFDLFDASLIAGQIGFYSAANADARFSSLVVADATRRLGDWIVRDEGTTGGPSIWRMGAGSLRQFSAIAGGSAPDNPGTFAVCPGLADDCRLTVRLRSDSDAAIGVAFRFADTRNHYRFSLGNGPGYRRLIKKVGGMVSVLWQDAGGYPPGTALDWTFDLVGNVITGYLGGARIFRVIDGALKSGAVALYAAGNDAARFEGIELRVPPLHAYALLEDRFAQGSMAGWSVRDEGSLSGPSAWSVAGGAVRQTTDIYSPPIDRDTLDKPGTLLLAGDAAWRDYVFTVRLKSNDDDAVGVVFRYADPTHFLRFSWDSQRRYRRLVKNVGGTWTLLWQDDVAYEVGREYELAFIVDGPALRGFLDGVPLFAVDDFSVPAGRIGLYSWGNNFVQFRDIAVYPLAPLAQKTLLDDPLQLEVAKRWTAFDDGDTAGPSSWTVADGWMKQTSAIADGGAAASPAKPGTYNLAGSLDWADYRLTVQLQSSGGDGIGAMVRVRDSGNYYRFSMDANRGYRRLIRKSAAGVAVLWQDAVAYDPNQAYLLTIDCLGRRLTGCLNGIRLFDVEDATHGAGRIALYCWGNETAQFNELMVTPAVWQTYYQFGAEEIRPAGRRIAILSGNPATAPAAMPLEERYFRADMDDRGRPQLAGDAALMRLLPPFPVTAHQRQFLADTLFAPVACQSLRKADGTAFLLFVPGGPPPGSRLDEALYRLHLRYRRDNRALQPASQRLSQAGESGDEEVVLDIPWATRG